MSRFLKEKSERKLVQMEKAKSTVPETLEMEGGVIKGSGGLLIDGKLTKCRILSTDDSPIYLSALSTLDGCIIDGKDVLFEGMASGEFTVKGDCEIGMTATIMGSLHVAGDMFVSKYADKDDLRIFSLKTEENKLADEPSSPVSLVA